MAAQPNTYEEWKSLIDSSPEWAIGCLIALYRLQVSDKQQEHRTNNLNGQGFNAFDAQALTSISQFYLEKGFLTPRQAEFIKNPLKRHISQLISAGVEPLPIEAPLSKPKLGFGRAFQDAKLVLKDGQPSAIAARFNFPKGDPRFAEMVDKMKTLPDHYWKSEERCWRIGLTVENVQALILHGFSLSESLKAWHAERVPSVAGGNSWMNEEDWEHLPIPKIECHVPGKPYVLRSYQSEAVDAGIEYLKKEHKRNGIEVLPTGSGKSLVIANIAKELGEPVLVFQPSKEILEQNYEKLTSYGYEASVYSASVGAKVISNITFATIGSTFRKTGLFKTFRYVLVDECHSVNSYDEGSMYNRFLTELGGRILGFTATPYRLQSWLMGSVLKFLTRTRPRIFQDLVYYVQNGDLFRSGYLSRIKYLSPIVFDRTELAMNSAGSDFTDASVKNYYKRVGFKGLLVKAIKEQMKRRKNILVFTRFVEEAHYAASQIPGSHVLTAQSPKDEREKVVEGFRSGRIPVVCNVGILIHGFDYPELECVVLARPTMSLALYYQMIGRGIRPHPDKDFLEVVDMCGNLRMFGRIENLLLRDGGNGKWYVSTGKRQLTNVIYSRW